jgi:hypothetical protein
MEHFLYIPPDVWKLGQALGYTLRAAKELDEQAKAANELGGFNFYIEIAITDLRIKLAEYLSQRRAIWGIKP